MGFLDDRKQKLKESNAKFKESMAEANAKRDKRMAEIRADSARKTAEIKADYKAANTEAKSGWAKFKQEQHDKAEERKAEANAIKQAQGNELGYVKIGYVGGFDNQKRTSAKLVFYEHRIEYSLYGQVQKGLIIDGNDVVGIEVGGQHQTNSRISVTRMAALGVFSLAAPKRTTVKDAAVTISLKDGRQVYFHTQYLSEFEVHSKLANAISYYSKQVQNHSTQSQPTDNVPPTDPATEIMKYATLMKRGVITQDEFEAKKKQLLNL